MVRVISWLTVLLVAFAGACSGKDKSLAHLAEGCLLNTDCEAPLVCAFQRCHQPCNASRDCPSGERCVESDGPFDVCQLVDERDCAYHSDCPKGKFCSADQQCRDQCAADRDCLTEQVCIGGTCADEVELRDGGLMTPVAPPDAASTSGGQPCRYTSECEAPLVCKNRFCAPECLVSADCRQGYDCVNNRCTTGPRTVIGPQGGVVLASAGKIELRIPAGSLSTTASIAIFPVEAWPSGALGPVFQIEPTGLAFGLPATLTYHYVAADIGATAPAALRLGSAIGARWVPLESSVDIAASTVSTQIPHLSIYGLVGPEVGSNADAGADASLDAGPGRCNMQTCSGATADGCCPASCTATTDADCAGCGNGRLDPGETCDPASACPSSCPQVQCQLFSLMNAGTCQAACVSSGTATGCANGDGCCPSGCSSVSDSDCAAACGNGVVEPGERCDGNCPSKCDPVGCQERVLQGSAGTCDARCVNSAVQTACVAADRCCPSACTTVTDADCIPSCGNGTVESGEICDGDCPTSCPAMGCQLRVPSGSAQTCNVQCVDGGLVTACANNDECCPAGCNARNDSDCAPTCGNGVVESGETCDPVDACATASAACVNDANTIVSRSGSAANCTFACARTQRPCGPADMFCPTGVACGPTTDTDCPGCGNARIEPGETCDPPSMCRTQMNACVSDANNIRTSSGSVAACTYRCTTAARTCGPADGFCPTGCGPTMDVDCPGCGNGRVETGETCDVAPASPTCASLSCNDGDACTTDVRSGSNATCNVACAHARITACANADGCCPAGCNSNNDNDCGAVCGNGVREGAETCEVAPGAPLCTSITCNDNNACTTDVRNGANATCNVTCSNAAITACVAGDGCCPGGGRGACNANNDRDCTPLCGNGVREGAETCEVAPATPLCTSLTCDDGNACTVDVRGGANASCNVTCTNTPITVCSRTGDGCCPAGCNATTDVDCPAVCGNGIVEPPAETCDTALRGSCPGSCAPQGCILPDLVNGGTCTAACVDRGRRQSACIDADGCCPAGCTDFSDSDCPTKNDVCASATDISAGGDFRFSLMKAAEELPGFCSPNGPEVFFQFRLTVPSAIYLDVLDSAGTVAGNVALELYLGGCPPAGSQPIACDPARGGTGCDKAFWPRIFLPSAENTSYVVAARAMNGSVGRYTLRFQRVPVACIPAGALPAGTDVNTTCTQLDQFSPTCGAGPGLQDRTYYLEKCPVPGLSVDTCNGRTGNTDTILLVNVGSLDVVNGRCAPAASGKTLACNDDAPCAANVNPSGNTSSIVNVGRGERGIFTVTVDTIPIVGGPTCGPYGLTSAAVP